MKVLLLAIVSILLVNNAVLAATIETINDENIAIFLEIFPQYQALINAIGQGDSLDITITAASKNRRALEELFAAHGLTLQEFALLVQKITLGYMRVKVEQEGLETDPFGLIHLDALSEEEHESIRKHFSELHAIFEKPTEPTN